MKTEIIENADDNTLLLGHYKMLSVISKYANSNRQVISRSKTPSGISKYADVIPLVLSHQKPTSVLREACQQRSVAIDTYRTTVWHTAVMPYRQHPVSKNTSVVAVVRQRFNDIVGMTVLLMETRQRNFTANERADISRCDKCLLGITLELNWDIIPSWNWFMKNTFELH